MSLSDQERDVLVSLQIEKADKDLIQADKMLELKFYNLAANRYYYACFHILQALLIKNKFNCHTHAGTISTFGLHFVKEGKVDVAYGRLISHLEDLREKADYNCFYEITEEEAERLKCPAHEFQKVVKSLISEIG